MLAFPRMKLLLFLALTTTLAVARPPIVRVPDAMYLYDFGQPPLSLRVIHANAQAFSDPALTRTVGTLRFPQTVQATAFLPAACRITGNARQGRVAGWVALRDLEPLPDDFLQNLTAAARRREMVEALIARNEAAIGMTMDEVRRALGRPQRTSRQADRFANREVWEYVRYRLMPQTTTFQHPSHTTRWVPHRGIVTTTHPGFSAQTQMVRVPIGKTKVTFENGVVSEIRQTEGAPATGRATVVAPPVTRRLAF
jgi:hypothetical protein